MKALYTLIVAGAIAVAAVVLPWFLQHPLFGVSNAPTNGRLLFAFVGLGVGVGAVGLVIGLGLRAMPRKAPKFDWAGRPADEIK